MNGNSTVVIVIVVVLILLAIWHCHSSHAESYAPQLGTILYSLKDNAYSKHQLPDFSENVKYDINSREHYHPHTLCKMKCRNETGTGANAVCVAQCMGQQSGTDRGISCSKTEDCPNGDICVTGGAYSGMPDDGVCMDPRESFNYGETEPGYPITCFPGDFFNEYAGRCEPRYQGSSSAWAVRHQPQPEHPEVSIPGATTPAYGVGQTDPLDVPTDVTVY